MGRQRQLRCILQWLVIPQVFLEPASPAASSILDHRGRLVALGLAPRALVAFVGKMADSANPLWSLGPLTLLLTGHVTTSRYPHNVRHGST